MTDDILKELIPDVKTDFEHNALNVYVNRETLQQQTENLRRAVNKLIEITEATKNYCIDEADNEEEGKMMIANSDYPELVNLIEQIIGKKYSEI